MYDRAELIRQREALDAAFRLASMERDDALRKLRAIRELANSRENVPDHMLHAILDAEAQR